MLGDVFSVSPVSTMPLLCINWQIRRNGCNSDDRPNMLGAVCLWIRHVCASALRRLLDSCHFSQLLPAAQASRRVVPRLESAESQPDRCVGDGRRATVVPDVLQDLVRVHPVRQIRVPVLFDSEPDG
jgi:hypothetical protein